MPTSAAEYLDRSVPGRHPALPETTCGTVRLDIHENAHTDHWYLTIDRQNVGVSRSAADAELVVRADRDVFDRLAAGRIHIGSALLTNEVSAQGNLRLLMTLRRIFPGPPEARHPREVARTRGGRP